MRQWKPKIIKANGAVQRSDTTLTKEVVATLLQMILSGKTLYPKQGYLEILERGETRKLLCKTLQKWIERNNVIPETGQTLRDVLNRGREEYRSIKEREKSDLMVSEAEKKLHRAVKIKTTQPVIGMFGAIKDKETGKIIMKENPALLKAQIDAAKYITERLAPDRYGKVKRIESKNLVFSLSELRKYEEEQERMKQQ